MKFLRFYFLFIGIIQISLVTQTFGDTQPSICKENIWVNEIITCAYSTLSKKFTISFYYPKTGSLELKVTDSNADNLSNKIANMNISDKILSAGIINPNYSTYQLYAKNMLYNFLINVALFAELKNLYIDYGDNSVPENLGKFCSDTRTIRFGPEIKEENFNNKSDVETNFLYGIMSFIPTENYYLQKIQFYANKEKDLKIMISKINGCISIDDCDIFSKEFHSENLTNSFSFDIQTKEGYNCFKFKFNLLIKSGSFITMNSENDFPIQLAENRSDSSDFHLKNKTAGNNMMMKAEKLDNKQIAFEIIAMKEIPVVTCEIRKIFDVVVNQSTTVYLLTNNKEALNIMNNSVYDVTTNPPYYNFVCTDKFYIDFTEKIVCSYNVLTYAESQSYIRILPFHLPEKKLETTYFGLSMDPDMSYIPNTKKMVILLSSEFEYTTTLSGFEIIAIKSGLINISNCAFSFCGPRGKQICSEYFKLEQLEFSSGDFNSSNLLELYLNEGLNIIETEYIEIVDGKSFCFKMDDAIIAVDTNYSNKSDYQLFSQGEKFNLSKLRESENWSFCLRALVISKTIYFVFNGSFEIYSPSPRRNKYDLGLYLEFLGPRGPQIFLRSFIFTELKTMTIYENQVASLDCGRKRIYFHNSTYGNLTQNCFKNVAKILNEKCYLNFTCSLQVKDSTLGDSYCTSDVEKQLNLEYECLDRDIVKYNYIGCYQISQTQAELFKNSPQDCITHCSFYNYQYAGVTKDNKCKCYLNIDLMKKESPCDCNANCNGTNVAQYTCGGNNKESVFRIEYFDTCYQNINEAYWEKLDKSYYGQKLDHCFDYTNNETKLVGCYKTNTALSSQSPMTYCQVEPKISNCIEICRSLGLKYANIVNGNCQCADFYYFSTEKNIFGTCDSGEEIHELIYNLILDCPLEVNLFENFTCSINFTQLPPQLSFIINNHWIKIDMILPNNNQTSLQLKDKQTDFNTVTDHIGYYQINAAGIDQPTFKSSRIVFVKDIEKINITCQNSSLILFEIECTVKIAIPSRFAPYSIKLTVNDTYPTSEIINTAENQYALNKMFQVPGFYKIEISESLYNSSSLQIIEITDITNKIKIDCPDSELIALFDNFTCKIYINMPYKYGPYNVNISSNNSLDLLAINIKIDGNSSKKIDLALKNTGVHEIRAFESKYGSYDSKIVHSYKKNNYLIFSCAYTTNNEIACNISLLIPPPPGISYIVNLLLNNNLTIFNETSFQKEFPQFRYTFLNAGYYELSATELTTGLNATQKINITKIEQLIAIECSSTVMQFKSLFCFVTKFISTDLKIKVTFNNILIPDKNIMLSKENTSFRILVPILGYFQIKITESKYNSEVVSFDCYATQNNQTPLSLDLDYFRSLMTDLTVVNFDELKKVVNELSFAPGSSGDIMADLSDIAPQVLNSLIKSDKQELTGCFSNCTNTGRCQIFDDKFKCECQKFYKGDDCKTDIRACSSSPCQNNGTCIEIWNANSSNTYSCRCKSPFFYGNNCENKINLCLNKTCSFQGKCFDNSTVPTCKCFRYYSGVDCEIKSTHIKSIKQTSAAATYVAITLVSCFYLSIILLDYFKFIHPTVVKILF